LIGFINEMEVAPGHRGDGNLYYHFFLFMFIKNSSNEVRNITSVFCDGESRLQIDKVVRKHYG